MAVGIPFKDAGEVSDAGAVMVLYGDPATGRPETAEGQLLQRPAPEPVAEPDPDADPNAQSAPQQRPVAMA